MVACCIVMAEKENRMSELEERVDDAPGRTVDTDERDCQAVGYGNRLGRASDPRRETQNGYDAYGPTQSPTFEHGAWVPSARKRVERRSVETAGTEDAGARS